MNIQNSLKKIIFPHQHPEAALRYLPIVDLLKKEKLNGKKILEIGSGSYGITPYLKRRVTGVDFDFSEPETPRLHQVRGKGEKLPFKDDEFEVGILSDVLEHIPKIKRDKTLNEAIRVSSEVLIISGPFGMMAKRQDSVLADYSRKKLGSVHHFFEEHLKYGLPEEADVEKVLRQNKKVKSFEIVGHFSNLKVREWLMKRFLSKTKIGYYFYLKGMMVLVPIIRHLNWRSCYRTVIKAKLK